MNSRRLLFALTPVLVMSAYAQDAPPEKALKYYAALLKRPQNAALFDRFFGAWIDEQPVEKLEAFLVSRAEKNGGQEWSVLARYQLRQGQEDNALASLAKAIAAEPDDTALPMARAKIRLRRMEFDAARADLAKVTAGKDEALALEAAKMVGKSWLRQGKSAEAVKAWDALLAAHPGDEDLLEDLVESAAADGETAQALIYVNQLIAASADPYKKTLRAMRRGDLLAQAGKNDEAVEAYAATLAQVGEGSWLEREVLAQIEKVFRKQDRLSDLAGELKKLADANPRRLLIQRQLAKLEAAQGEADSAIGRFREVLKRSPGDRELREEFVRLLVDGERFDDAVTELEKMIEMAPADAELQLQLASLRSRQGKPEAVLATLKKAHELLGKDEGSAIRISSLMFQYALPDAGEALLKETIALPGAGPAPAEALAAQYARLNRRPEALELLKKVGASDEVDVVIRAASSISALGESLAAFEILTAKAAKFASEPRFLAAIAQTALAANKPADAVTDVVKLVRLSKQTAEIGENIGLANRVLVAADQVLKWRKTLEEQTTRTPAETCLLAELLEGQSDFDAVAKLMDGASDPLVVHFYAALLDRRGEFDLAIATLSRLADTEEGRKAAFFKDMSELQQRAGKTIEALATVERWKQSAPGDKTAWITGSRLLRDSGKPEEAVKMTRQAVARFEGDSDLAASLASLHEDAGQWADAEAIYWRLYDDSQTPADQARWAVQLAQLAMRNGKTEDLAEKLQERARGNRLSIGPILAQAELARVTQNDDKRRDLLLEAVRLQPKDVDLRLQIANLEEQSGNPDRVVAILEEAIPFDTTNRIRTALAQAYLRQGQTMKGMRELQALSGKNAKDPRSIESNAATLAGAGLYEEAIRFMRDSLPDGGDWRTKYLLAVMLEQDGRETEAVPIFLALQQATGELPGITANPQGPKSYMKAYPEDVRALITRMAPLQMAYAHQKQRNSYGYSGASMLGPFAMPDDADDVRNYSMVHLCKLAKKEGMDGDQIRAGIRAAGVKDVDFVSAMIDSAGDGQPDFTKLLKSFPDQPGLLGMVLIYASYNYNGQQNPLDPDTVEKAMQKPEHLSPLTRFRAALFLTKDAKEDDPAWAQLFAAAQSCLVDKDKDMAMQVGYQIIQSLSGEGNKIPDSKRQELKKIIVDFISKCPDDDKRDNFRLFATVVVGTREEWIAALNQVVKRSREKPTPNANMSPQAQTRMAYSRMNRSYNPWANGESSFTLPSFENLTFTSLPNVILYQICPPGDSRYGGAQGATDPKDLLKYLDQVESPVMRAWIALRAEDGAAITKALSASPPKEEAVDFNLLTAYQAIRAKKFVDAYALLEKSRAGHASDPNFTSWLNTSLVAVASEMTPEERKGIADSLKSVLLQCRQVLGVQAAEVIAAKARQLGYEDLAKRFQPSAVAKAGGSSPLGPAGFGQNSRRSSSSTSGGNGSIDKVLKFDSEKKYEAAAREALLLLRQINSNPWNSGYELRELLPKLSENVRTELLKITDPGDSTSLTKRMEYVDICIALEKKEQAVAVLEKLITERPDDASIAGKLAFLLPIEQNERALALMTKAAESDDFVLMARAKAQGLSSHEDNKETCDFFETVAIWLEGASPGDLEKANLTWIPYHAREFFETNNTSNLPNLFSEPPKKLDDKPAADRREAIAKRLALAMLRHPSIAEAGFRLLSGAKAWMLPPEELDVKAREVLAAAKIDNNPRNYGSNFFTFRSRGGSSSSGTDRDQDSSVKWITDRLAMAKSPAEVLPPDYLQDLRKKNPKVGELVSALAGISNVEELAKLWESDRLKSANDPVTIMLRQGVLARAGSVPGASKFFISRIREIPAEKFRESINRGQDTPEQNLFVAALSSGVAGKQQDLDEICAAISKVIFGDKIDWTPKDNHQRLYQQINLMQNILNQCIMGPAQNLKLQNALFRRDIPVGSNEYQLFRPFQGRTYQKPEELVAFFESLGWLADAKTWEPSAAIIVQSNQVNGKMIYTRETKLLNDRITSYMNTSFSRSAAIKLLRERKPLTFGALITAASMTSGSERSELAAKAFDAADPELKKMLDARVEAFSLLLPWLPQESLAKLPPSFREKAKTADGIRRKELVKQADEFLANTATTNRRYSNPFDESRPFSEKLVELDFAKGLAVFLEAERRFTTGLTQGGQLSSYTSNGIQITERDEAMGRWTNNSDSPLYQNPALVLRFYAAILQSPQGGRFSLAGSNFEGSSMLSSLGALMRRSQNAPGNSNEPDWLRSLKNAAATPEDVRADATLAVLLYQFNQMGSSSATRTEEERQTNRKLRGELTAKPDPRNGPLLKALDLRELLIGINGRKTDNAEGRSTTSKAFVALTDDAALSETTRMQFAFDCCVHAPDILQDSAISSAIAPLFEHYCEAERSAVNPMGLAVIKAISSVTLTPESLVIARRLNDAFWKNANAPKAGGHSSIPEESASDLFVSAALVGDAVLAKKLLSQAKLKISGNLQAIISLISAGQFDLANSLLSEPGRVYRPGSIQQFYTPDLESKLAAFSKAGIDPLQFMRIECQLLKAKSGEGDLVPKEKSAQRAKRLVAAYKQGPPKDRLIQSEMLYAISSSDFTLAQDLTKDLSSYADGVNLATAIKDACNDTETTAELNPRDLLGKRDCGIARHAALASLLQGDASRMEKFAAALTSAPPTSNRNNYNNTFSSIHADLINQSIFWLAIAVADGKTDAFAKSLKPFEDIAIMADSRREIDSDVMTSNLALCQFLANWSDQSARFPEFLTKMKTRKSEVETFTESGALSVFYNRLARNRDWKTPEFTETRRKFFAAIFSRPSLAPLFPPENSWLYQMAQGPVGEDLMAITAPMPASFIPEVRAQLIDYRGDHFEWRKQHVPAIQAYRAALLECQPGPERNQLRAMIKYDLAQALFNAKEIEEAKTVYASIPPAEIAKKLKTKFDKLGKNLAAPEKPKN